MGGSVKVQKCADVIYGWSLFEIRQVVVSHKKLSDMDFGVLENNCMYPFTCMFVPIRRDLIILVMKSNENQKYVSNVYCYFYIRLKK